MPKCYQIYTHKDLDGAVSLLTFLWAHPEDYVSYNSYNNLQIPNLKSHIEHNNNPCSTYILDLALRQEFLPDLDLDYITFIDHHFSSSPLVSQFKNAKVIYKDLSSNALLMAQLFKENYPARTDSQKMLIALADDFDCYRLNIPESYDLNIIFWSFYKNNFAKFIKDYMNGFKPFTPEQKKAIQFIKKEAENEASSLPIFEGTINFGNKPKRVIAALADKISNTVIDVVIKRHQPDVLFFINSKSEKVCLRQTINKDPVNLGAFAEKICEGGGHNNAAGGIITPIFMEITKNLKPIR
jgi:oligoribonuclease NrnB/cAMP/cGMP phosphodiesterase (DHH superfamily)